MEGQCRPSKAIVEEKINVTVRLRPLNEKEMNSNDYCAWKCLDEKTIVHVDYHNIGKRASFPQFYFYDQVFGFETSTKEVYERGAKDVALSALTGKNATIFAYGQTSSGKTYTMRGIMENAADDIFEYISQHPDTIFLLKFSALEIYNEVVNDLLNPESSSLRLLDDPEKGTVVEGLMEEIVQSRDHLHNLLAFCQSHRQVEETALNDISSRSHQIIRLMIESSPRVVMDDGPVNLIFAVLNFIDLAGSERASLSQSDRIRLKEGCYINRSLLTLSTVIRKLSESNRGKAGHVPYRDSKLTRILQYSLGGNARTAIICTISPSQRHVEQTRNTLFFASCAKEITNRAQINMVISEKDLIRQLKKEVALLEAKLQFSKFPVRSFPEEKILEKEIQIQKMQDEIRKMIQQRDFLQSQLNSVLKQMESMEQGRQLVLSKIDNIETSLSGSYEDYCNVPSNGDESFEQDMFEPEKHDYFMNVQDGNLRQYMEATTSASDILLREICKLEDLQTELAHDANKALEVVEKEVECLCTTQLNMNQEAAENVALLQAEIHGLYESRLADSMTKTYPSAKGLMFEEIRTNTSLKNDEFQKVESNNDDIRLTEEMIKIQTNYIDVILEDQIHRLEVNDNKTLLKDKIQLETNDKEKRHSDESEIVLVNAHHVVEKLPLVTGTYEAQNESVGFSSGRNSVDEKRQTIHVCIKDNIVMEKDAPPEAEESVTNVHAYVTDLKERVAQLQHQKDLLATRISELEKGASNGLHSADVELVLSPQSWKSDFHTKLKQIFELWDVCNISIMYRSHFYFLFRGDPSDAIYVEVELKRLIWLRSHTAKRGPKGNTFCTREEHAACPGLSLRTLKHERETLVKLLKSALTSPERDEIYRQWGVSINAKKRKLKLISLIWTNPYDEDHVKMSAELVGRLLKVCGRSDPVSKDMFLVSFSPVTADKSRFSNSSISNFFSF